MAPSLAPTSGVSDGASLGSDAAPSQGVSPSVDQAGPLRQPSTSFRDTAVADAVEEGTTVESQANGSTVSPFAPTKEEIAKIPADRLKGANGNPEAIAFLAESYRESEPTTPTERVVSRTPIEPSGDVLYGEEVEIERMSPVPERYRAAAEKDPSVKAFFQEREQITKRNVRNIDREIALDGADTATLKGKPYSNEMKEVVLLDPEKALARERKDSERQVPDKLAHRRLREGQSVGQVLERYEQDKAAEAEGKLGSVPLVARERALGAPTSDYDRILEAHKAVADRERLVSQGKMSPNDVDDITLTYDTQSARLSAVRRSLEFLRADKGEIRSIVQEGAGPEQVYGRLSDLERTLIEKRFEKKAAPSAGPVLADSLSPDADGHIVTTF